MEGFGGHGDRDDTTPLPPEAMAEEIWNPQSAEEIQWLCDQLREWPVRVHPDRTCNITYLMKAAATRIAATSAAEGEVEALKAAIFGSDNYDRSLKVGNFIEMVRATEAGRIGAIDRATKAEAENVRLREALNMCRDQHRLAFDPDDAIATVVLAEVKASLKAAPDAE